jgi:hypothetical protein
MVASALQPVERRCYLLLYEGKAMTAASTSVTSVADHTQLPGSFLNCYEVTNPASLVWSVRLYKVVRAGGSGQSHGDRGEIKQAIWDLRKQHVSLCRGLEFVVDVDEETVAVPTAWELPSGEQVGNYRVTLGQTVTTDLMQVAHRGIITGILREAVKARFKHHRSDVLGDLWQDFNRFCQVPSVSDDTEFHFCRQLGVIAKVLRGNRWVLQTLITLKVCAIDIYGHASLEDVVHDLLWEADMCFTKLDIGMSLPWVLHVADTGALQFARSYWISGITA